MALSAWLLGAGYLLSCSLMLITNKLCVQRIPAPAHLHTIQFAFSAAGPLLLHSIGAIRVDGFDWAKARPNLVMAVISSSAMYFNMAALRTSDVSTILVVRACCPLVDCFIEHLFLGHSLPSRKGGFMLLIVMFSAVGYMLTMEHDRQEGAYALLACYFIFICGSDTFGKWVVSGLQWENKQWGPVVYSNVLSIPYQVAIAIATHEEQILLGVEWTASTVGLLLASCVLGLCLSYFGWCCRDAVSATAFALLGIANKVLSLIAAALIWEPPSLLSTGFLVVCLAAAALYAQPRFMPGVTLEPSSERSNQQLIAYAVIIFVAGTWTGATAVSAWSSVSLSPNVITSIPSARGVGPPPASPLIRPTAHGPSFHARAHNRSSNAALHRSGGREGAVPTASSHSHAQNQGPSSRLPPPIR